MGRQSARRWSGNDVILSGEGDDNDYGDSQFGSKGSGDDIMLTGRGDDISLGILHLVVQAMIRYLLVEGMIK